jgi:hypothetical protein
LRVRMGWSGETDTNTWHKVDIELEQEDMLRLFREHDLQVELNERLPTKVCFQLLQNEAEMLLLRKLITLGYPVAKANARIAVALGSTHEIVTAIKAQLTPA